MTKARRKSIHYVNNAEFSTAVVDYVHIINNAKQKQKDIPSAILKKH